jgi:hypothetical protein
MCCSSRPKNGWHSLYNAKFSKMKTAKGNSEQTKTESETPKEN